MDELQKLELELNYRGFSPKTKKSYLVFVQDFLKYSNKRGYEASEEDIKKYISHLITDKKYTNITANLAISSLKFFFRNVLNSSVCDKIECPKREKKVYLLFYQKRKLKEF